MNEKAYICSYKIVGFPFVVLDKSEAERWVYFDKDMRYFTEVPLLECVNTAGNSPVLEGES